MNAFLHALTFLTRIPIRFHMNPDEWKNSPPYYPLVGVVIGCFLWVLSLVSVFVLPPVIASVCVLTGWIWITGGLHLDGLMDTADGIGSARSKERMIEIMKDSRVGAMGVLGAIVALFFKVTAIYFILTTSNAFSSVIAFVIPPVLARSGILLSISSWPYLHGEDKGMASGLKQGLTPRKKMTALLMSGLFVVCLAGPWLGTLYVLSWLLCTYLFNQSIIQKLGGLSGDTYGALVECSEIALLFVGISFVYHGGTAGWQHLFG